MAAPLVPLSQQVRCWGAPRGGAGGWCRGKGEAPRKRGSRERRRRRRAPRARAALKVTGRRGPRTLAPGDPPRGCDDVTGRGRRAYLLRRHPARLTGAYEPCRASSPRRWARTVGPVLVFVSCGVGRRGGWRPCVESRGDPGRAAAPPAAQPSFPREPLPLSLRAAKSADPTPPRWVPVCVLRIALFFF